MWELFKLDQQYARYPAIERGEVQKFTEWIRAQPHMPDLPEEEALLFYYACKCSLEFSKQVLDTYLTCRTHVPEIFGNLDVNCADMKRAMKTM